MSPPSRGFTAPSGGFDARSYPLDGRSEAHRSAFLSRSWGRRPHFLLGLAFWCTLLACTETRPLSDVPRQPRPGPTAAEPPAGRDAYEVLCRTFRDFVAAEDFKGADRFLRTALSRSWPPELRRGVEGLKRRLRRISFLHHHPLVFRAWTQRAAYAFGEPIPVYFEVINLSDETVTIPDVHAGPFPLGGEKRDTFLLARFTLTDVDARQGTNCSGRWDVVLDPGETWVLDPGESRRLCHTLALPVPRDTLYRRIEVQGRLLPGGLQTGPFDWGMIPFEFPARIVHALPPAYLSIQEAPWNRFRHGLENRDMAEIFLGAALCPPEDRWRAVDGIVSVLHAVSPGEGRAFMCLLSWLTGETLGYDADRWLDWWDVHRGDHLQAVGDESRSSGGVEADRGGGWSNALLLPFAAAVLLIAPPGEATASEEKTEEWARIREHLLSPYYGKRFAAVRRLRDRGRSSCSAVTSLLADPEERVRAGAAAALGMLGDPRARNALVLALKKESVPLVRARIVQSLGLLAGADPAVPSPELAEALAADPRLKRVYLDRAVMKVLEGLMHYHSTPGSYDGQYRDLWVLGPGVYDYLAALALDPDVAFHVRALSIMALQERKRPDLVATLRPLILDPEEELRIEENEYRTLAVDEASVLNFRRRNLSKYARFSLAKAGIVRFNLDKIRVLERWISRFKNLVFRKSSLQRIPGLGRAYDWIHALGMNFLLDIGYNYQQFDRYDKAEEWYLRLIASADPAKDSAYLAEAYYNLACLQAVTDRGEEALKSLQLAINNGFTDASWMQEDRDLESLRQTPAFRRLLERMLGEQGVGREGK